MAKTKHKEIVHSLRLYQMSVSPPLSLDRGNFADQTIDCLHARAVIRPVVSNNHTSDTHALQICSA